MRKCKRLVHNHGPEEGPGLACRESLIGDCLRDRLERAERECARLRDELEMIAADTAPWHTCTHAEQAAEALTDKETR